MSIVTISRGSYSRGKEVAEQVARELGYDCVSREILLEASEVFNVPETTLVHAVHDAPSILDRFTRGDERYVAFIRETLLRRAQKGEDVCFELALDQRYLRCQLPDVVATACRIKSEAITRRVQHCQLLSFLIKFCSQHNYQRLYVADHVVDFDLLTFSQRESSGHRPEALQLQVGTQYPARRSIGHPLR